MAFLNGIFQNSAAPAPAAPAAPATPAGGPAAKQPTPANPAANPATMTGQPGQEPAGGPQADGKSTLDNFTQLFAPKPADPNAPKAPTLNDPILGPLDPAKFKEQIGQANFAASIPQETLQKAISGDTTAFADAINHAAREAFAAAAQLSHGLVENGVRTGAERLNSTLDSRFRNLQLRNQNTTNAALNHPAVAPMLNAVKMQIAQSNPNLSPAEVQQHAETYFTEMASALTSKPADQTADDQTKPKTGDFSYLLA